jgi:cytochrome c biogenesis protein CcdA
MIQLIIGGFALSVIHGIIPNHWIPIVTISKSQLWSRRETIKVTTITGLAHTASTVLIGIVIGLIGYKLSETLEFVTNIAAPSILIAMGIIFLLLNKSHHHHENFNSEKIKESSKKSKLTVIISLGLAMFLSPCIEIEAYYFTAGALGWIGIATLSIVYLLVTLFTMVILVDLGRKGIEKLNLKLHFFEHNEKVITGTVLIILGVFSYFIKL